VLVRRQRQRLVSYVGEKPLARDHGLGRAWSAFVLRDLTLCSVALLAPWEKFDVDL
jgi:hypothetical protein